MPTKLLLFLLLVLSGLQLQAQLGGDRVYGFLDLPSSAQSTALGGDQLAVVGRDPTAGIYNPSLLADTMHNQLTVSQAIYVADISFGQVAYARKLDSLTTLGFGLKYLSYGDFQSADPTGLPLGTFSANEQALTVAASHQQGNIRYGLSLKTIFSTFEAYSSNAIAADAGVSYYDPEKRMSVSLLAKNMGAQLSNYNEETEPLPFDLQLGFSKRLEHVPFRFMVMAHHLHQWNILYDDPNADNSNSIFGTDTTSTSNFTGTLFRHLLFSGELYIGKSFTARIGYNYLRRQELSLTTKKGTLGLSFGFGIRIRRFYLDYGRSRYHLAGGINHFTVGLNLNDGFMKKKVKKAS